MRNLTEANLTEAVVAAIDGARDPRLKAVVQSLVEHLHAFIREVEPTDEEWMAGIRFLTGVGHMCDESRQEFILLSDSLGVTALKDAINTRSAEPVTEATVRGPFYREGAAEVPHLHNIAGGIPGEPVVVSGRVTGTDGVPIAGAVLDVWQATGDGFYDVQMAELQGEMGLRGKIRTDLEGRYSFRSIKPSSYPIPHDGPVGRLLTQLGRHPYRPAHIHFIVSADGCQPVVTELFVEGDPYLESDAVFGVKDSLIVPFVRVESAEQAAAYGFTAPYYEVAYDFVLSREP
jgi:protocatechuate 3,4-dioxygenase beta subunit